MSRLRQWLTELRRRRVFRAAGIYVVGAWVAVQAASLIFPAIEVPESAIRYVWLAALLVFPVAIVFAWFYELSLEGLKRTPAANGVDQVDVSLRGTDFIILIALGAVSIAIAWHFTGSIRESAPETGVRLVLEDVDPHSIAVLPLDNLSGDPEQQYFVSGMQDALISVLSRVGDLKVTSKTSTLRFGGGQESLPSIAAKLGVANLIEGSVFRVGDRVRISVQLVDAAADQQIWSDSFEEDIENVLTLQRNIATAIAEQVQVEVSQSSDAQAHAQRAVNPAAYEAFLRGQFHVERFTRQDMTLAGQYYQQSVALDPDYALAHYGLSKLCAFQAQAGFITPAQARERCLVLVERVLALDSKLPEANMAYAGHMTWQQFDWEKAAAGFERAIELNPSYAEARLFYSHFLTIVGRLDEASTQIQRALELDPLNPFTRGLYGAQLLMIGDYRRAVNVLEEIRASTPGFGFGFITSWQAYHRLGEEDKAVESAVNLFRKTRGDEFAAKTLEDAYAELDYDGALLHAASTLEERAKTAHVVAWDIAMLYEQAGNIEKAVDWFELAYERGDPDAPYMGVLPKNPLVLANPRFIDLLRRMKLDYWADKNSSSEY